MKYVIDFSEGSKEQSDLLGGKGANLAEMTKLKLPVPTGFTITTEACLDYLKKKENVSTELNLEIRQHIFSMEKRTQKKLGDAIDPLLVSVRSGSKFSMPGMMDTILNLGLNDETVIGLTKKTGDGRFAFDCYRRLLQMFGDVVCGIDKNRFEEQLDFYKSKKRYLADTDMQAEDWQELVAVYKDIFLEVTHQPFPQNPYEQLSLAVEAVFRSWNNRRAVTYRRLHDISDSLGTAVNIQEMVFGNFGEASGTGVAFTRNPATGEKGIFGEFLLNAQGEDVVAGIRTPQPISELEALMPEVYQEFLELGHLLESHYKDMQDIEFTIENRKLYLLQTRNGKRTAKSAFKVCIQLVEEGIISKKEAIKRINPTMITQLLHPVFEPDELKNAVVFAKGLPASPGAASGNIYFTAEKAKKASEQGEKVILIRQETSPEDIEGMVVSEAIVTSRGGMTSHAAVVARGMGVCCVAGCETVYVNEFLEQATAGDLILHQGDTISVDGTTGTIYLGSIPYVEGDEWQLLETITDWAKEGASIGVKANAETPADIKTALKLGAQGIGLARTEHMFFGEERIVEMRKMILAENKESLLAPLDRLKEFQKNDFRAMFTLLKGKACTIRLLDPPLHEFLPQTEEEIIHLANETKRTTTEIKHRIEELHEQNPMLGHRGCRLAVTTPEIYEMQVAAIIESAIEVAQKEPTLEIVPEIMIPLIGSKEEMAWLRECLEQTIQTIFTKTNQVISYKIGTMLEIPRACLTAEKIAEVSDFFSFGTNDLTQLTYGFSRDDSGKFIKAYQDKKLLKEDPFQHIDEEGVGALMKIAVDKIRGFDPSIKIGVCGEVGGDPQSIRFLKKIGVDYISCSPYRIPAAILTIAQEQ
ncbi:pyruvate, phosphate dikinase [Enterococcus haemoperoxidus ATCC BAA-382]|uniref:Pyruvate, phosphate dikinase n=1 Tax=Enterococcus haemoperoxidus ATCC BAA-382 TaxID=1158608 RepID=R2TF28_9ENTE|nr:pyruvate, phosphate dikinase [Enterococcus haemoperoxidus]EOH98764.1 pyruvate, phosphate dikinase [Enterococcus haemoperoxidus ATCC BAA-382]EOT62053.1 pyruvate, phosphate dikinase [Enterococcus haemoperoxidus ATCC BAA-382]OJG55866.1 pyruvate, phosphate dikinase [Enterococcus haemoperoxidus]